MKLARSMVSNLLFSRLIDEEYTLNNNPALTNTDILLVG
jgi:hypothetical protein